MSAPCSTWDIDPAALGVCSGWSDYGPTIQQAALDLATFWLWAATGRRFGPCPVTVRPSQPRTGEGVLYQDFSVLPGQVTSGGGPYLFGGRWFNSGTCASACCGSDSCSIELRGPVYSVEEVRVDGEVVPASAYRVDVAPGRWMLVRVDGECWPTCQNFRRNTNQPDTFEVSYEIGEPIPAVLALAAGALACEYGKFLSGGACSLPAQMTRLSRQGVEVEVAAPDPEGGKSGIKLVDDVVAMINPSGLRRPPQVLSPDLPGGCDRVTVIATGS